MIHKSPGVTDLVGAMQTQTHKLTNHIAALNPFAPSSPFGRGRPIGKVLLMVVNTALRIVVLDVVVVVVPPPPPPRLSAKAKQHPILPHTPYHPFGKPLFSLRSA